MVKEKPKYDKKSGVINTDKQGSTGESSRSKKKSKAEKKREKQDKFMKYIRNSNHMLEKYRSGLSKFGTMNECIKYAIKGTKYEREWKGMQNKGQSAKGKSKEKPIVNKDKEQEKETTDDETDPFLNFRGEVIVDSSDHAQLMELDSRR